MSKKTKKQKIIADLRRKININETQRPSSTFNFQLSKTDEPVKIEPPENRPTVQNGSLYIYPVQLIKKDLTKTLLLCILAISLELALFLVLERHIVLPFR